MNDSPFDRLYGIRRSKQFRKASFISSGLSLLALLVYLLDPVVNHSPIPLAPTLFFGILALVTFGLGLFFHLQYLSQR